MEATFNDNKRNGEIEINSNPLAKNQVIRVYNQNPMRYLNREDNSSAIESMTADLPRIAAMKFNAVWVNPLQSTSEKKAYSRKKGENYGGSETVSGSLYAMADETRLNPGLGFTDTAEENELLLKTYTGTAKYNQLIPIFDLVLHHIGGEIENQPTPLQRKYGEFLSPPDTENWQDTVPFNYREENIDHIFKVLWAPFIYKYIVKYGFMGVRIDMVSNLADINLRILKIACEFIRTICLRHYGVEPIIMGELMAMDWRHYVEKLQDSGFTHIYAAGAFYNNFHTGKFQWWLMPQVDGLQQITADKGGVICFEGNHDVGTLKAICLLEEGVFGVKRFPFLKSFDSYDKGQRYNDRSMDFRMREKILFVAING